MQPLDDFPIDTGRDDGTAQPPRRAIRWRLILLVVGLLLALGAAAVWWRSQGPAPERTVAATEESVPAPDAPAVREPLGPAVEPRELPPLELTDSYVRDLLRGLSSSPQLAAWLASDGLVRRFVASVDNVARGTTPAPHLRRLAPAGPFLAQDRGDESVIDPRSYARYNGFAETVGSLDVEGLARAYVLLRPRLQEAYRELGNPDGDIDRAVEAAIVRLLRTPRPDARVAVRPSPVMYKFADDRLESLSPAQKQLLRMGPRNVDLVQEKLRALAAALKIPADRLAGI
jgi:hypothetical protein